MVLEKNLEARKVEFMSLDYTLAMRGVAILMVMLQHLSGFVLGSRVFTPFGGGGVAIFLIISGYGLTLSAKNKGLNGFWSKKAVRVFFPWMVVWAAMVAVRGYGSEGCSWDTLFLLTRFNWYLQYLLLCYAVFYVGHKWCYRYRFGLLGAFAVVTFLVLENIQAEQAASFIVGCLLAEKESFYSWTKRHLKVIASLAFVAFVVSLGVKQVGCVRTLMENVPVVGHSVNLCLKFSLAAFVMAVCFIGFRFVNGVLSKWIGKISYELYLVHLFVVVGLCKQCGDSPVGWVAVFLCGSFVGAWLLYQIDSKVLSISQKRQ